MRLLFSYLKELVCSLHLYIRITGEGWQFPLVRFLPIKKTAASEPARQIEFAAPASKTGRSAMKFPWRKLPAFSAGWSESPGHSVPVYLRHDLRHDLRHSPIVPAESHGGCPKACGAYHDPSDSVVRQHPVHFFFLVDPFLRVQHRPERCPAPGTGGRCAATDRPALRTFILVRIE